MKKIKLIINPSSGRQSMEKKIDILCKLLLDDGYIIAKFFTKKKDDAMLEATKTCNEDYDIIIVSGGDGTVNEVAKGIMVSGKSVPLAILASGTVNDFANYIDIPKNINDFYNMIKEEKTLDVDIGMVSGDYFVNVAAGGLLTNIAYQVSTESKTMLGRLAYYFEGVKELAYNNLETKRVKINSKEFSGEEDILLFLISNSSSIGGFKKIAPEADILDGLLDVVIIKKSEITDLANIFVNVLTGDHINHQNVIYFKTSSISIESTDKVPLDLDGEFSGYLPAQFNVIPNGLKIII